MQSLNIILTCLLVVCIFDPGDKILYMKVPLFLLSWLIFYSMIIINNKSVTVDKRLLNLVCCMLLIPLVSITYYCILNGIESDDGLVYYKSYLFVSLAFILYAAKINLIPTLSWVLTFLSLLIFIICALYSIYPDTGYVIYLLGLEYGNISISNKQYGGYEYTTFFYMTSLMLAIAISYFTYKALITNRMPRIKYSIMALINIYAMFLGGSRNNILVSLLLPLLVLFWYSKKRNIKIFIMPALLVIIAMLPSFYGILLDMFSLSETSNAHKAGYLVDYLKVFVSNPINLFLGQGIGSSNYWEVLGGYASITELTLLELFRNYGLIGGCVFLIILLYPLKDLWDKSKIDIHYYLLGYLSYLFMALFNPIFFTSSGMLLFAIIIANTFSFKSELPATVSVALDPA